MKNVATTRTILLVEDDPHDRLMVRRLLQGQRRSYVIHEAATGEDGLRRCRDLRPDCILLDYYLPDMDGREWIAAYHREIGRWTPVPVAMLTGRDDDEIAAAVLEDGAQDYLVKDGATAHGLTRAIENAIEKFRIRRELEEQRAAIELRNRKLEVLRDELQTKLVELADATKAKDRFLAVMSRDADAAQRHPRLRGPARHGARWPLCRRGNGNRSSGSDSAAATCSTSSTIFSTSRGSTPAASTWTFDPSTSAP